MTDNAPQNGWTPEQKEKIGEWLKTKWGARKCSQCDSDDWSVGESPVSIGVGNDRGDMLLGQNYPCIAVFCVNCGHLVLLSSMIAGIVSPRTKGEANG